MDQEPHLLLGRMVVMILASNVHLFVYCAPRSSVFGHNLVKGVFYYLIYNFNFL